MLLKFDTFGKRIHAKKHLKENLRSVIHSANSVAVPYVSKTMVITHHCSAQNYFLLPFHLAG